MVFMMRALNEVADKVIGDRRGAPIADRVNGLALPRRHFQRRLRRRKSVSVDGGESKRQLRGVSIHEAGQRTHVKHAISASGVAIHTRYGP
jgi:hypothetical protein